MDGDADDKACWGIAPGSRFLSSPIAGAFDCADDGTRPPPTIVDRSRSPASRPLPVPITKQWGRIVLSKICKPSRGIY